MLMSCMGYHALTFISIVALVLGAVAAAYLAAGLIGWIHF